MRTRLEGDWFDRSHVESGHKSLWINHIPPNCLCANWCAKRTPHLLHRNATCCTETPLVAQKRHLLHRNAICCTETPPVAQKCCSDSLTMDAHERRFALVPRLPTGSPGAKPKQSFVEMHWG